MIELRADAARNRQQILGAARETFSTDGVDVSMAEIARRSGVGFATLLRRFATKEQLLEAVLEPMFLQFEATMDDTLGLSHDPWLALEVPLREFCRLQAAEPGLSAALALALSDADPSETCVRIGRRLETVLQDAQRAGQVRADATVRDLVLVALSVAGVLSGDRALGSEAAARVVDLILESLHRPTGG